MTVSMRNQPFQVMRHALVTGASGFIGRALCSELQRRGVTVTALARRAANGPWQQFHCLDLGVDVVPDDLCVGVDTVFHLAARVHALDEQHVDESAYVAANVEATRHIVTAATRNGVGRLVHFSSVKAMGEGGPSCQDEAFEPQPCTAYGRSKLAAEAVVAAAVSTGLGGISLRLPLVYGPGCKGNLARMLAAVQAGRFPPLADIANRRSMVHVDNVVQAACLAAACTRADGQVYIITDREAPSTTQLLAMMRDVVGRAQPRWTIGHGLLYVAARLGDLGGRMLGRRLPLDSDRLDKLLGSAWYTCERAQRELGYVPEKDLLQGLHAMHSHHERNFRGAGHAVAAEPEEQAATKDGAERSVES